MTENSPTLKRWRLILGLGNIDADNAALSEEEENMDAALGALYEYQHTGKFDYGSAGSKGTGGKSTYNISRWLGDIRNYFPDQVVRVMQNDAMKNTDLQRKLIQEPELLEQTTPDIHLASMLLQLKKNLLEKTLNSARYVIRRIVDDLTERLQDKTRAAISGAINRSARNHRPKLHEMDWNATILKNLRHYQPEFKTVIPERKIGFGRKRKEKIRNIILCLDQSASMAESLVYSGIFANVLASMPTISTRLLVFDTQVTDLSDQLDNLVELLFGIQLGGGTNINKALQHCQSIISKPGETILVLISDLEEGDSVHEMRRRIMEIKDAGVQIISLLTLSDEGRPNFDHQNAQFMAHLEIPVFACTPDLFPEMMAAAINGHDIRLWAGYNGIFAR